MQKNFTIMSKLPKFASYYLIRFKKKLIITDCSNQV